jgi:hypothetical protein
MAAFSTMEVKSAGDAVKMVDWYTKRWGIEVYHRTLKSGCRIEDRQLEEADRLETCLGIDMVVAWRVFYLTMLAREKPDLLCTAIFEEEEWISLCCLAKEPTHIPTQPPTMHEAVFMVASLGGHLGRKCDGFPGTQTIWRGLIMLCGAIMMYIFITRRFDLHPKHSGP